MSSSLWADRYQLLIRQLYEEEVQARGERGATNRVAARLGVTGAYVSMIRGGKRAGGERDSLEKAIAGLRIRMDFFQDTLETEPYYRDYLQKKAPGATTPDPPFWREFLRKYDHAADLTPELQEDMRSMAGRRGLVISGWQDWIPFAEWLRLRQPSVVHQRKIRRT